MVSSFVQRDSSRNRVICSLRENLIMHKQTTDNFLFVVKLQDLFILFITLSEMLFHGSAIYFLMYLMWKVAI